jgi:aryl-alcohol dehydrogenase
MTGAGAVWNVLVPRQGATIPVTGAGAVGLSAVMAAKLTLATRIIAVDRVPARLELARELGATHTIDTTDRDLGESIVFPGSSAYAVSKAAVWSMSNALRQELAGQGTLVTSVHLGAADTNMMKDFDLPKMDRPRSRAARSTAWRPVRPRLSSTSSNSF